MTRIKIYDEGKEAEFLDDTSSVEIQEGVSDKNMQNAMMTLLLLIWSKVKKI